MASTLSSRKLWHVLQYLMKQQMELLPMLKANVDGIDQRYIDGIAAMITVSRLRDEELRN